MIHSEAIRSALGTERPLRRARLRRVPRPVAPRDFIPENYGTTRIRWSQLRHSAGHCSAPGCP